MSRSNGIIVALCCIVMCGRIAEAQSTWSGFHTGKHPAQVDVLEMIPTAGLYRDVARETEQPLIRSVGLFSSNAACGENCDSDFLTNLFHGHHNGTDSDCGFGSCNGCTGCGDCACSDPLIPTMFGDTGLGIPRLNDRVGDTQAVFQNHFYKIAENNSVVPQNRVGVNVNYLPGVYNGLSDGSVVNDDLFEYRFFVEKTLFSSRLSVDFMLPFYHTSTYNPGDLSLASTGPSTATSFGDLAFGLKYLLYRTEDSAWSAGVRVEAPTNEQIKQPGGRNIFYTSIQDDVWHFTPFTGLLLKPTDRVFVQSFLSCRLNTGTLQRTTGFTNIREQSLMMADVSVGYWMYQNSTNQGLTGVVPSLELHYTGTLDNESPGNTTTARIYGNSDVLNLTAGLTAYFNDRASIGLGVVAPLRNNPESITSISTDRRFDCALMFNVNYYFGR